MTSKCRASPASCLLITSTGVETRWSVADRGKKIQNYPLAMTKTQDRNHKKADESCIAIYLIVNNTDRGILINS